MLYEHDELLSNELRQVTGNYDSIKKIVEKLEAIGVVKAEIIEKPRLAYKYSLTNKGRAIAQKIQEIDELAEKKE